VEIVRPPSNKKNVRTANMKVLIATDGSKFSELALRFVVHRPWPTGSEVKIKDLNNSALKEARTVADAGSRMLSRLEGKVSTDTPFPQGSIAGTIVKKAEEWGAQLIVLGPHGRRKFDRLMLGSVSEHVAFHGHVRSK
jgi:nucleotide-binding universal stress UspA family protein